ncbi:hypothetical protein T439DRAFT_377899 [Meredithblackwellia eburnea MCA 4105]
MSSQPWIQLVPTYNGGFIVLAYVIAVLGSWTTLELLLRRAAGAGLWNALLLVAAGIAFGSTATFGMHFVGNQSVRLEYPPGSANANNNALKLSYDVGYTILSLVVSCLSMIIAFSFIGLRMQSSHESRMDELEGEKAAGGAARNNDSTFEEEEEHEQRARGFDDSEGEGAPYGNKDNSKSHASSEDDGGDFGLNPTRVSLKGLFKILGAGFICGGGVAAMHYIGQVSINSVPRVTNTAYVVVLSVIIAIFAVSLGLYLLFVVLRPKLDHKWYKRLGVSMILGLGTSLMHFVALLGTHYWVVDGVDPGGGGGAKSRVLIIALVCVVAPVCCLTLLVIAIIGQAQVVRNMAARHRVIVSVALFDQQGHLLVQPNGLLPSAEITPPAAPPDIGRRTIKELADQEAGNVPAPKATDASKFKWTPSRIVAALFSSNRLSLEAMNKKLTKDDPAFIAYLKASWSWRNRTTAFPAPNTAQGTFSPLTGAGTTGSPVIRPSGTGAGAGAASEDEELRLSVESFEQAASDISFRLLGTPDHARVNGVLYDGILKTGHFQVVSKTMGEKFTVTQGQMLVLARRIKSQTERQSLIARGFTFAEPGHVARVTAGTLAVPPNRVLDFFRDVYRFTRFGVVRRIEPARVYVGVMIVQALPGSGLQVVVDQKMHHSLPLTELGYLSDAKLSRGAPPGIPAVNLDSIAQGTQDLGGRSLYELIQSHRDSQAASQPMGFEPSDAAQLRGQIVGSLVPLLESTLSPEMVKYLDRRLMVVPTLIPLLDRGATKESFLICLKAVVPASVELPGRLNWTSFALFRAQAECVAQDSNRRLVKLAAAQTRMSESDQTGTGTFITESSHGGSVVDPDDDLFFPPAPTTNLYFGGSSAQNNSSRDNQAPSQASHTSSNNPYRRPLPPPPPSFPPVRPAQIPSYDPDWVVSLIRPTAPVQVQAWDWIESSRGKSKDQMLEGGSDSSP